MKKIGIITFHNSYNCGSMLESYAIQTVIDKISGANVEIVNFSNKGQKKLYSVFFENNNIKNIVKNVLLFPHKKQIKYNNSQYEKFKNEHFVLSKPYSNVKELHELKYDIVVAGSDQIWNITIEDGDDAYFLPWVKDAKKVAYAPSFGARKIKDYTNDEGYKKYSELLRRFDALSIREENGKKWLKEMVGQNVPVLIGPTLLLDSKEYEKIMDSSFKKEKYIFYYNPSYSKNACEFVRKIAKKYGLKVLCWSAKNYHIKRIKRYGFELVEYESPSAYLNYIKNADLVITGSFHGTIFSTIFRKKFYSIYDKTYGNDDRLLTLVKKLGITERYIDCVYDDNENYLKEIDYKQYTLLLNNLKKEALYYLNNNIK